MQCDDDVASRTDPASRSNSTSTFAIADAPSSVIPPSHRSSIDSHTMARLFSQTRVVAPKKHLIPIASVATIAVSAPQNIKPAPAAQQHSEIRRASAVIFEGAIAPPRLQLLTESRAERQKTLHVHSIPRFWTFGEHAAFPRGTTEPIP